MSEIIAAERTDWDPGGLAVGQRWRRRDGKAVARVTAVDTANAVVGMKLELKPGEMEPAAFWVAFTAMHRSWEPAGGARGSLT